MRAVTFEQFGGPIAIAEVPAPTVATDGAVIRVQATGLCRSDWHGWVGHDPDIALPHVPGHEFAGTIEAVGADVTRWQPGDRVTVPFVCACGECPRCLAGDQQVCDSQFQPGFSGWGSFAELVAIRRADLNVIRLPDSMDFATAASLGCRFATSYRAVLAQGRVRAGEWVAVHGCGGVGLSAVQIAVAAGARVVVIDVSPAALAAAEALGAEALVDAREPGVADAVVAATGGGAHLSLDALGSTATCLASIGSLRKRGRHVQVGLMIADAATPPIPMDRVVAWELEILGSHGMAAHEYPEMLARIAGGSLRPDRLVGRTISLDEVPAALVAMGEPATGAGMTVILPGQATGQATGQAAGQVAGQVAG
ncbi:MAG: zinc-dependent alcohol dehydrogenase family protein [Candidatus Limnocylindrales bacterium]